MNELGMREKAVGAVVVVLALYALAVGVWFFSAESAWKRAARKYDSEQMRFAKEEKLISERRQWNERYESAKSAMPTFDADKATDTTWLQYVTDLAQSNRVYIAQLEAGPEIEGGDVLEQPITGRWQASLDSLTHFMHALENAPDGMFDIREISVKPIVSKPGYLEGSISITCAYMRN